jgi:hypothetical protein
MPHAAIVSQSASISIDIPEKGDWQAFADASPAAVSAVEADRHSRKWVFQGKLAAEPCPAGGIDCSRPCSTSAEMPKLRCGCMLSGLDVVRPLGKRFFTKERLRQGNSGG